MRYPTLAAIAIAALCTNPARTFAAELTPQEKRAAYFAAMETGDPEVIAAVRTLGEKGFLGKLAAVFRETAGGGAGAGAPVDPATRAGVIEIIEERARSEVRGRCFRTNSNQYTDAWVLKVELPKVTIGTVKRGGREARVTVLVVGRERIRQSALSWPKWHPVRDEVSVKISLKEADILESRPAGGAS